MNSWKEKTTRRYLQRMKEAEGHANAVHAVLNLEEQENRSAMRLGSSNHDRGFLGESLAISGSVM
jgi:hypothetical protein